MASSFEYVRVIDITQVLAGPYCSYQLGLLGAEVIKIELPGTGDWTRAGGAAPRLGEHTAVVLRRLGLSDRDLRELQTAGVIASVTRDDPSQ